MKPLASILFFSFVLFIFWGCHPTKNVSNGQYLLNKNIIKSNKSELKEDLSSLVKQKTNRRILGVFRFHLGVYNLVTNNKTTEPKNGYARLKKRTKDWIRRTIGEEPVILDSLTTIKSLKQLELYLHNKGFYNAIVKDTTIYKNKKAKVIYQVETKQGYTIRNVTRESKDPNINTILTNEKDFSLIKTGDNYDVDVLQKERERFTTELKNRGYYYFNKEFIYYKIDSALNSYQVDITMGVRILNENSKVAKESFHHTYKINEVYIQTDYNSRTLDNLPTDTLKFKEYYFVSYQKRLQYKPDILLQKIYIKKDDDFKAHYLENTYRGLSDLGVFKFTNIRFEETKDSNAYRLNCFILLSPSAKESFTIETEGTYNGGNLGVAGNLSFRNKNLFRGAELFEFKLKGALEAQRTFTVTKDDEISIFNTIRVGPEVSLNFQKFLLPFTIKNLQYLNPRTTIPASFSYEKRPGYDRTSTNISLNYNWSENIFKSHSITLVEINKVNVDKTDTFAVKLRLLNDPFISSSYNTHLTTVTRYSFFYNNQDISKQSDFVFFRFSTEFSGNILRGINTYILNSPITDNSYKILGVNYSQFIRPEFDFRYYHKLNPYNTFVYRIYSGVGYAYKNSTSLPIEKLFFAGGASDIRGWQARTLGPGSYRAPINSIDQNGDLKLEGNLEYRFYLFKLLEGAAFIDAGNIWALNKSSRKGSEFNKSTFLDEIAIAAGLGARFNLTFFIFRIDAGIKIKDPSNDIGKRYVYQNTKLKDINWNIGIGYPF